MQFKKNHPQPLKGNILIIILSFFLFSTTTDAQTAFLNPGDKANILLERMEIKAGKDSAFNFSKTKPFSRRSVINAIDYHTIKPGVNLSKVDAHNVRSLYINNLEWVPEADRANFKSKKPIGKSFYQKPANLYEVHVKDFDLILNPVIQFSYGKENDYDQSLFLNSRGVTLRGKIANKIGFYTYLTDNQERVPTYAQQWANERKAVPGNGFYKSFKTEGYDYFEARGYITFGATKYIDIAFGYDKNFIGNGHRSLMLSDFSSNMLFFKLNTRIWKINYQNIFAELQNAHVPGGDKLIPKKYAAIHHLDIAFTKWLNMGLYEAVIFGRKDRFDFGYLNPIIFYRSIEQQNGSFDNSIAGIDFKANVAKKFQFYNQIVLDEFLLSEIKKNRGWWANKWAIQLGAKYIDAFNIKNLDLQIEHNRVRPFTYSHRDSVANFTHYNQPLAHPLGANFSEWIGILRYQPAPKWLVNVKMIYYTQGKDSNNTISYGSNIFYPNTPPLRNADFGYEIGEGWKTNVFYGSLLVQYELKENLFIELNALYRKQDTKTAPITSKNTTAVSLSVRWNMHRREFDY
jgi:hypothetical protein